MKSILDRLGRAKYTGCYLAAIALLAALAFAFLAYPRMAGPEHLVLDPDRHGDLGMGIWKYHSFSHYPDHEPTVVRGPLYPAFIAALLALTNGWWPYSVQLAQCIMFALTVLLVFWTARTLWNGSAAVVGAALVAAHPLVFWYTSRILVETVAVFLFTVVVAATVFFNLRPSASRAVLLGALLGLGALCKQTFLPYILLVPLLLFAFSGRRHRISVRTLALVVAVGFLLVAPWTVRNWRLAGKFIPVHINIGQNMDAGDGIIENFHKAPFALAALWDLGVLNRQLSVKASLPKDWKRYQKEIKADNILLNGCTSRYRKHPGFLLKKVALNAVLFWMFGETLRKSAVLAVLQFPMVILFTASVVKVVRRRAARPIDGIIIVMIVAYYLAHLPILSEARYSVVLAPSMIAYGIGVFTPVRSKIGRTLSESRDTGSAARISASIDEATGSSV